MGSVPSTNLATYAGFELGMAFTTMHRASEAWKRVRELIETHDEPGVDWLFLSAGAPNRAGQLFLSEEFVAHLLMTHPETIATTHIRRVTLHLWSSGAAVDLHPEVRTVFGPLHQGETPAYRGIVLRQRVEDVKTESI
jgi:hypothetical protein